MGDPLAHDLSTEIDRLLSTKNVLGIISCLRDCSLRSNVGTSRQRTSESSRRNVFERHAVTRLSFHLQVVTDNHLHQHGSTSKERSRTLAAR